MITHNHAHVVNPGISSRGTPILLYIPLTATLIEKLHTTSYQDHYQHQHHPHSTCAQAPTAMSSRSSTPACRSATGRGRTTVPAPDNDASFHRGHSTSSRSSSASSSSTSSSSTRNSSAHGSSAGSTAPSSGIDDDSGDSSDGEISIIGDDNHADPVFPYARRLQPFLVRDTLMDANHPYVQYTNAWAAEKIERSRAIYAEHADASWPPFDDAHSDEFMRCRWDPSNGYYVNNEGYLHSVHWIVVQRRYLPTQEERNLRPRIRELLGWPTSSCGAQSDTDDEGSETTFEQCNERDLDLAPTYRGVESGEGPPPYQR